MLRLPFVVFPLLASLGHGWATESGGGDFFEKKVRPILSDHCYKCHSHSADKIKGGLVLDSADGALTGGDTGPAVVPGDLAKSLLITAITYADEDLQMPPKGKKLTDEQIGILQELGKAGRALAKERGRAEDDSASEGQDHR